MVGTGKLSRVLWCKFHNIWFLVHLTINIFIFDFGLFFRQSCTFFKSDRKTQSLAAFFVIVTVAGELCKLARVTGPEFPLHFSPVRCFLPATGRCRAAVQKTLLYIVQELCESRGGRPGMSVLTSLLVSVDVKLYWTMLRHWSQLVPNMSTDIRGY